MTRRRSAGRVGRIRRRCDLHRLLAVRQLGDLRPDHAQVGPGHQQPKAHAATNQNQQKPTHPHAIHHGNPPLMAPCRVASRSPGPFETSTHGTTRTPLHTAGRRPARTDRPGPGSILQRDGDSAAEKLQARARLRRISSPGEILDRRREPGRILRRQRQEPERAVRQINRQDRQAGVKTRHDRSGITDLQPAVAQAMVVVDRMRHLIARRLVLTVNDSMLTQTRRRGAQNAARSQDAQQQCDDNGSGHGKCGG